MPSTELVQIIIQGGAVGLALVSMGLIYVCLKMMGNHLTDVATMLGRVAQVLEMVVDRLDGKDSDSS